MRTLSNLEIETIVELLQEHADWPLERLKTRAEVFINRKLADRDIRDVALAYGLTVCAAPPAQAADLTQVEEVELLKQTIHEENLVQRRSALNNAYTLRARDGVRSGRISLSRSKQLAD